MKDKNMSYAKKFADENPDVDDAIVAAFSHLLAADTEIARLRAVVERVRDLAMEWSTHAETVDASDELTAALNGDEA